MEGKERKGRMRGKQSRRKGGRGRRRGGEGKRWGRGEDDKEVEGKKRK